MNTQKLRDALMMVLSRYNEMSNELLTHTALELSDKHLELEQSNSNPQEQVFTFAKLTIAMGLLDQRGVKTSLH